MLLICLIQRSLSCLSRGIISPIIVRTLKSRAPRVRFAPSPTGYLHVGGLRTALYNRLFAASRGGALVLRIEDTDQSRRVEGATEALERSLEWAGVCCDEGPSQGGDYGPYVQSERLDIYRQHIQQLLENDSAYLCFCSERRLELLRREALRTRQVPRYDNRCRTLGHQEREDKLAAGAPHCVRFKLSSECLSFEDLIFGGIAYDVSLNEGDPVILKSDGFPTYHFANVVDDHLMRITHVLRGVEWQISTTKHILLYRAFGWEPPQFGHLPLIVNRDGTKLSKRQNDVTVEDYRNKGVLPLALVNFMALSGGGFDHVPGEGVRIRTMEELAGEFRLERVSSHPSRLNPDLLNECNRLEILRQLKDERTSAGLVRTVQALVRSAFRDAHLQLSDEHVRSVTLWAAPRLARLDDLVSPKFAYLWILPDRGLRLDATTRELLGRLERELAEAPTFDRAAMGALLRGFAEGNGVQYRELMRTLRAVLSGLREGPGVAEMLELLGREVALQRITNATQM